MSSDLRLQVIDDLAAETAEIDAMVARLDAAGWRTATPAKGWTVAHQIAHLAWTDEAALLAATDPDAFGRHLHEALADPEGFVDKGAERGARADPAELLARWRTSRADLDRRLREIPDGTKVPWYGPPMSAASMATARLMETWAHGLDVADALGVRREPTGRLRHVAHLGVRTRDYAYLVRELAPPTEQFRVELTGPAGEAWTWGCEDAPQRVTGPALDFCLLVTQRRHRDDLALSAVGADAERWLDIAQAFAGPAGPGRSPDSSAVGRREAPEMSQTSRRGPGR
ncbi:MAG TPA: TIGR03084 family metal-binding protein [Nocardioidaceae bacterium]|nr:TIGR03084 family metal-binding protein [Nocardioidaceae bacterium]